LRLRTKRNVFNTPKKEQSFLAETHYVSTAGMEAGRFFKEEEE
jgi:hypothetical protein